MSTQIFINNVKFVYGYVEKTKRNEAGFYIDITEMQKHGYQNLDHLAKVMVNKKHGAVGFVFDQDEQTILIPSKKLIADELEKIIMVDSPSIIVAAGTKEGLAVDAISVPLIIGG